MLTLLLKVLNLFMEQLNNTCLFVPESCRNDCWVSRFSGAFFFSFFFFFKPKVMLSETKSAVTKAACNSGDEFSCYP